MSSMTATSALADILRQPDDLLKLGAYRKKLLKEKSSLDAKLQEGVKAQLDATRDALLKLQASRAAVALIREEMMAIEKLKESEEGGDAFDKITRVSTIHRNFAQTTKMVNNLRSMSDKVDNIASRLDSDRNQPQGPYGPSPNLLPIHYQLQQLEAFRNETMHQAKKTDQAEREILAQWFEKLDKVGADFEAWLWMIASGVVDLARKGNGGTVVRLLKIVEFEGKEDEKAVAMRLVRRVANTDAASKFKSMQANARVIKNYRHKLLDAMTAAIKRSFDEHYEKNQYDLLSFIDGLSFMYKDIIRIKDDVEPLFPPDYEILAYLVKAYHRILNETLRKIVDSAPEAKVLLELHAWIKEYRQSMKELELPSAWLQPPLLDGKSQDLIEDYVKLIVTKLDEWTANLMAQETGKFQWRTREPEQFEDGQFGMEGVVDFFQLVNQQCDLALDSNQGAVLARVVTESAKVMRRVQQEWLKIVAEEARFQVEKKPEEVPGGLVEYVIALANDQLKSADYAEALSTRLEPLVSDKYKAVISARMNEAIDGYLDVAKQCTSSLVTFVFNDLRTATRQLITPQGYSEGLMPQIIETIGDYMGDYQAHLNPSIFDILIEDLLDELLIAYLTALRNAPPRTIRMPGAVTRIKQNLEMAFDFFAQYKPPADLEHNFEVMNQVVSMLAASSQMVFMDYWTFAKIHGPQLPFVEALMRGRDDFDRVTVNEIMETLRRKVKEENIQDPPEPTIMVRVQATSTSLFSNLPNLSNISHLAGHYAGQFKENAESLRDRL
ncbi:vesicle fusion-related protein [Naematelia encephala]|uniref:Vesicle fusion-related protein n=1 Tax=Naematelia encephala TaxID=71784 RepID=A0A1Y2BCW4_9TREE|nr:vesicle fusion-related protein [Naematelia encephala]